MKSNKLQRAILILLILTADIALDRISKIYIRNHVSFTDTIFVIKGFFTILRAENTGAFLSLGDSLQNPWRFILLSLLPLIALGLGVLYIIFKPAITKLNLAGIILVIAGGAGNLFDRMMYGSVTDFMHMDFKIFETGVFNVADMSIMAGMALILIQAWTNERKNKKQHPAADQEKLTA